MTSVPIWRLAPGQRLQYRCWDGECVLYNDLSGDTHLLDEFAVALLEQLKTEPQAAAQLAAAFELDAQEEDALLQTVLDDLAALFLVDLLPC
ncbi:HPr-rel-A system PqqD family peptide chaperone [Massilia suwonensis]|uniref:HPr-rel-A system PqqD family peptide chaperone n=1 Tax=Massilia suwonensis TaxID=648895 RepID=A0ABW0MHG0_9BURK